MICTGASFICYVMGRLRLEIGFLFSIIYMASITWLIIKEKNNNKSQKLFFVYSVFLLLNMLINYVLFADITDGIINNVEIMLVNGAMYGLQLLASENMMLLLIECVVTYGFWIIYTVYHLIKKYR